MRTILISLTGASALIAVPAAAQQATITYEGPNRSATVVKERTKTDDGVIRTRDVTSGDYSSSRTYQRTRTENGFNATTDWSNSNGKTASGSTNVARDGNAWSRSSQQVGPNGGVRSVDQRVRRGANGTVVNKKLITSPQGNTRTVRKRTKRSR